MIEKINRALWETLPSSVLPSTVCYDGKLRAQPYHNDANVANKETKSSEISLLSSCSLYRGKFYAFHTRENCYNVRLTACACQTSIFWARTKNDVVKNSYRTIFWVDHAIANLSPNYIISCKQIDSIINLGQLMMTKKTAHWITAARNLKSTKVNYFRSLALFWYDDSAAAQYNDGDKNAHASFFVCSSGCVPPHCQITLKCTKEVKLFLIDMISTSRKSHESRSLSWFGFCFDYIGSGFQRVKRRSATSGFPQRRSRPQKISLHGQVTWIVTFSASNHQSVWLCSEICS